MYSLTDIDLKDELTVSVQIDVEGLLREIGDATLLQHCGVQSAAEEFGCELLEHLDSEEVLDQIDTNTLIEEINDRGGVAAKDWAGLFTDDFTLIRDILDAIRDEGETGEIISWLKDEGYRVTNADDDDVIVIEKSKLESVVDRHIVSEMVQVIKQADEMKDVLLATASMLAESTRKTAAKSSERVFNGILAELNKEDGE